MYMMGIAHLEQYLARYDGYCSFGALDSSLTFISFEFST